MRRRGNGGDGDGNGGPAQRLSSQLAALAGTSLLTRPGAGSERPLHGHGERQMGKDARPKNG